MRSGEKPYSGARPGRPRKGDSRVVLRALRALEASGEAPSLGRLVRVLVARLRCSRKTAYRRVEEARATGVTVPAPDSRGQVLTQQRLQLRAERKRKERPAIWATLFPNRGREAEFRATQQRRERMRRRARNYATRTLG